MTPVNRRAATFAAALLSCLPLAAPLAGTSGPATQAVRPDGSTPLHWAVFEGNLDEARRLIKAGADVNAPTDFGIRPLHLAADNSNRAMIELLLKSGAEPHAANPEGETALHLVARSGDVEAARLLLKARASVDARETWGGQTPLMWAAARRHAGMVELLLQRGADVNARSAVRDYQRVATAEARAKFLDRGGFTPLLYAVRENCRACIAVLIRHGADLNLAEPSGAVPLSIAMMNANWDIAHHLIEAGADVNRWDQFGQSPLHVAVSNMANPGARHPLDMNQPNEFTGRDIVKLLAARGANPNQQLYFRAPGRGAQPGRGATPFLLACASGDVEIVKVLLGHGANAGLATADAQGPIIMAVSAGAGTGGSGGAPPAGNVRLAPEKQTAELVRVLAAAGADVDLVARPHFLQRTRGGSALHYAVRRGSAELITTLIELGANVNALDEDGLTALDYAMARGYVPFLQMQGKPRKDLADLLRAAGANVELAETPDWPPQGPPIGPTVFDAVIWPVDPVGP